MRRYALVLALPALAACSGWTDQLAGPPSSNLPAQAQFSAQQDVLPDRYIVVFRDDVQDPVALADQLVAQFGGTVHFRYTHAIKGFAATLPAVADGNPAQSTGELRGARRDRNDFRIGDRHHRLELGTRSGGSADLP
jgi:hypothetical protein